ncbi:MAG: SUMF1/EgtB/PvdO family nonheme iron enzyme [Planctomycetes bacterium]|nr:SUMF1/EgtB/PvdO family nonheme iron enzyme [Planctomycetota bacterium]
MRPVHRRCDPVPTLQESHPDAAPRVVRGGSFDNPVHNLRSANRNRNQPANANRNQGVRVALVPASSEPGRAERICVLRRRAGATPAAPRREARCPTMALPSWSATRRSAPRPTPPREGQLSVR